MAHRKRGGQGPPQHEAVEHPEQRLARLVDGAHNGDVHFVPQPGQQGGTAEAGRRGDGRSNWDVLTEECQRAYDAAHFGPLTYAVQIP